MRSELSKKNEYWIPKFRYLELKNWVRQYRDWTRQLNEAPYLKSKIARGEKSSNFSDPTAEMAMKLEKPAKSKQMVDDICKEVYPKDPELLRVCLTGGFSYDSWGDMPVSRSEWYKMCRKFFYILDKRRD